MPYKSCGFIDDIKKLFAACSEPCESSLFSAYINVDGVYWNCSFSENENVDPVNIVNCGNFLEDVWYSKPITDFRKRVLEARVMGECPVYGRLGG